MFAMIYNLLLTIGNIGATIGIYKLVVKGKKVIGDKLLAYSFFISALSNVMEEDYLMVVFQEFLAIIYYLYYLKEKEKEKEAR